MLLFADDLLAGLLQLHNGVLVPGDLGLEMCIRDRQKAAVSAVILPKMLVGGFTTVTIASVVFAGISSPFIFS